MGLEALFSHHEMDFIFFKTGIVPFSPRVEGLLDDLSPPCKDREPQRTLRERPEERGFNGVELNRADSMYRL